ncbi:lysozyme inhibitor LprI family protein [Erythrobacter sp. HL-111]|uniref:lysozyme inhibitor LprI family protein n=1 Tax=Erythrobacter sp. HL-111 TaxID=1798193 RepID=UPI0006DB12C3|nr:lysozyme inhibitor LprI family protein [Erythrobacter sp. HL-111]KPP90308.1 MAG: hypothetical protein HLUCCO15_09705 [Erythrobacteraceae bacterium HL-111]SDR83563.1 Uncharacterized conserved protein YecT, DUF1311 family [Erythrobacter sp. HL-111]
MLTALAPFLLLAPAEPPNPDWNCDEPLRQQEMNWCAAQDYEEADRALNAQWRTAAREAKERDRQRSEAEREHDPRPGHFASLLEAQRAWLAFRNAHCRLEGYVFRGGSAEPMVRSACLAALTRARTAQLREIAANFGA